MAQHQAISRWRRSRRSPGRAVTRWMTALVVILGACLALRVAHAYQLDPGVRGQLASVAGNAVRWSPEVWDSGQTLVFEVARDAGFEVLFDSPEGLLPYVERALAFWSDIPTADISWRVDGVGDEIDEGNYWYDGRNTILLNSDGEDRGAGEIDHMKEVAGEWRRFECDVVLGGGFAKIPDDVDPEGLDDYRESEREGTVWLLVHELGHCLGLAHSATLSTVGRWTVMDMLVHPGDPAMSYGYIPIYKGEPGLEADDVVGASLLRPAPGWQGTTGSVSGSLHIAGEPVSYASVWALPVGGTPLQDRIGAFSNGDGEFLIEGLPPGEYGLWAQSIVTPGAHPGLMEAGAPTDLEDAVLGGLVRVEAGQTSGDLEVSMHRGRISRPPPRTTLAKQEAGTPISITGRSGSPCSGVQIQAERPYPADGPLWFSLLDGFLRGDRWFGTTLTVEWSPESKNTLFDWNGPYRDWMWAWWEEEERAVPLRHTPASINSPKLDISISDWRIERTGSAVRHSIEIAWPESTEASLRFRSEDDACDGEPLVVCELSGCELRR